MYSIRKRLMIWLTGGYAAIIVCAGLYLMMLLEAQSTREFDATLRAKTDALAALTDQENGVIEFDYKKGDMPEFEREVEPDYFQFWLQKDDLVLLRSTHLGKQDLPKLAKSEESRVIQDISLPDGRPGRMMWRVYDAKGPDDVNDPDDESEAIDPSLKAPTLILGVARSREPLNETLAALQLTILLIGSVVTLLGICLAWGGVVLGFRPIKSIARQVESLNADCLDARIQLPRTPKELSAIVDQLNSLLERLDDTFQRERRFADNVAHELRTPIAELRSLATVGAQWPDDQTSVARFFEDVKDIAGSMEGVISDLLLLARCQAGIEQVVNAPTSLMQVLTGTWSRLSADAAGKQIRYRLSLERDIMLETDAGKLGIILANLMGNAVEYSLPETELRIRGRQSASRFELDITNVAEVLSSDDLQHIAEPFWRKDELKSATEHAGLGLPLVTSLAELLSLDIQFAQDPGGTFRVRLTGQTLEAAGEFGEPLRHSG